MLGALHITRWMISKVVGYTLGIMYPAFMSFKSLETGDPAQTGQWLTYWVVWSCITVLEVFEDLLCWVPLYYELKLCLVLWLIHPSSLGAVKIFESVVKPLLKTHSSRIEEGISFAEASASHTMSDLRRRAKDAGLGDWSGASADGDFMPGSASDLGVGGLTHRGGASSAAQALDDPEVAQPVSMEFAAAAVVSKAEHDS